MERPRITYWVNYGLELMVWISRITLVAVTTIVSLWITQLSDGMGHVGNRSVSENEVCVSEGYLVAVQNHPPAPDLMGLPALVYFDSRVAMSERAIPLATMSQIGTIHGVAFDKERHVAYVGAYFKYGGFTGPAGGHALYAIEVPSGSTRTLAQLPGDDRNPEVAASEYRFVGNTGLGDVEFDVGSDTVIVANLSDQLVYVLEAETGNVVRTLDVLGQQTWAASGRVFGLAIAGDRLYVGAVDSGSDMSTDVPRGYVLSVSLAGGAVEIVAEWDFDYMRTPAWHAWVDSRFTEPNRIGKLAFSQPMITDLWMDSEGRVLVGVRDRGNDMLITNYGWRTVSGDALAGRSDGNRWILSEDRDVVKDRTLYDEALLGSFANGVGGGIVATAMEVDERLEHRNVTGLLRYLLPAGSNVDVEMVGECNCSTEGPFQTLGGVANVCAGSSASPTVTATERTGTASPTPLVASPTPIPVEPTATATFMSVLYVPAVDTGPDVTRPTMLTERDMG
jgi:hypothetical protein